MGRLTKVARVGDFPPGEGMVIEIDGKEIALFNVEGVFYALENICPHRGGPLGEGFLEGAVVTCPWHGWKFDATTGRSPVNPRVGVRSYPVKVEGEDILVELPA
ncbi:MAG: Rieske (2Fe-2S) protein [Candidatus Methylomirabilales bacterium]